MVFSPRVDGRERERSESKVNFRSGIKTLSTSSTGIKIFTSSRSWIIIATRYYFSAHDRNKGEWRKGIKGKKSSSTSSKERTYSKKEIYKIKKRADFDHRSTICLPPQNLSLTLFKSHSCELTILFK